MVIAKKGWDLAVRENEDRLVGYESEPERVLCKESSVILAGGDKRWQFHSLDDVRTLSIKDVKAVLEKAIQKGPIEISLVGDISAKQAVDYVANTFGALDIQAQAPDKPFTQSLPPFKTQSKTFFHTGDASSLGLSLLEGV